MANKHVRSGAPSTRARSTQAHPTPGITPASTTITPSISLAGQTCDHVMELLDAFEAYLALELFFSPEHQDEARAGVRPSRSQLTALLRAMNGDMRRKLDALAEAVAVLQAQVAIDAALQAR